MSTSIPVLKNKTALVTGGSQGIGKAIAEKLASAGAAVAIAALDNESLARTGEEFTRRGFLFKTYGADLSDESQIGVLTGSIVRDPGAWDRTLQINLRTPFLLCRAIAPSMIERKSGKIVNMSSIAGKMAYPMRSPYAASKWGLVGLTLTLAQELGPFNIHVNAICPGPTRTEMIESVISARAKAMGIDIEAMSEEYVRATALKRMVLPEEVADLVLFLCSPQSNAITGQAIDISAGQGARIG
jgi:NAD(P)-dependent dehydrogenase (short-subunit alcohol dehydrogenase family)